MRTAVCFTFLFAALTAFPAGAEPDQLCEARSPDDPERQQECFRTQTEASLNLQPLVDGCLVEAEQREADGGDPHDWTPRCRVLFSCEQREQTRHGTDYIRMQRCYDTLAEAAARLDESSKPD